METFEIDSEVFFVVADVPYKPESSSYQWTCYAHNKTTVDRIDHLDFIDLIRIIRMVDIKQSFKVIIPKKKYFDESPIGIKFEQPLTDELLEKLKAARYKGKSLEDILKR